MTVHIRGHQRVGLTASVVDGAWAVGAELYGPASIPSRS